MNLERLIDVISQQAIQDVMLIAEVDSDVDAVDVHQAEGGPMCIQFERSTIIFGQPLGRESITVEETDLTTWLAERRRVPSEYRLLVLHAFELFCYRRTSFDPGPTIDKVVGYRSPDGRASFSGLLLTLSTGSTIGVDSSSDRGLRYFTDGHQQIFEEEYVRSMQLRQEIVWQR